MYCTTKALIWYYRYNWIFKELSYWKTKKRSHWKSNSFTQKIVTTTAPICASLLLSSLHHRRTFNMSQNKNFIFFRMLFSLLLRNYAKTCLPSILFNKSRCVMFHFRWFLYKKNGIDQLISGKNRFYLTLVSRGKNAVLVVISLNRLL